MPDRNQHTSRINIRDHLTADRRQKKGFQNNPGQSSGSFIPPEFKKNQPDRTEGTGSLYGYQKYENSPFPANGQDLKKLAEQNPAQAFKMMSQTASRKAAPDQPEPVPDFEQTKSSPLPKRAQSRKGASRPLENQPVNPARSEQKKVEAVSRFYSERTAPVNENPKPVPSRKQKVKSLEAMTSRDAKSDWLKQTLRKKEKEPESENPKGSLYERLMSEPVVRSFLKKNHLSPMDLKRNMLQFRQWVDARKLCEGCKSVDECRQHIKGALKKPIINPNGDFEMVYIICKHMAEVQKHYAKRENYLYSTLQLKDYRIELDSCLDIEDQTYLEIAMQMTASIDRNKGAFLYGGVGVGKTHMFIALANNYSRKDIKVSFANLPLLIDEIKNNMENEPYRRRILHWLKNCEVLFLDDLGSERISVWSRDEVLFPVLEWRMNAGLKTYINSNYTYETLLSLYQVPNEGDGGIAATRFLERIQSLTEPICFPGGSLRTTERAEQISESARSSQKTDNSDPL